MTTRQSQTTVTLFQPSGSILESSSSPTFPELDHTHLIRPSHEIALEELTKEKERLFNEEMRRRQIQLDFSLLNIQSCNTNVVSIKATEEKQRANYRQRDNKESLEISQLCQNYTSSTSVKISRDISSLKRHLENLVEKDRQLQLQEREKKRIEEETRQRAQREAEARRQREEAQRREREEGERQRQQERERENGERQRQQERERENGERQRQQERERNVQSSPEGQTSAVKAAPDALREEQAMAEILAQAEAHMREFSSQESTRPERRKIEREITLRVQQISATQQQIRQKTGELSQILMGTPEETLQTAGRCLLVVQKVLLQCESQVQQLPSFAFALGQVVLDCACSCPPLLSILQAKLHQICPLSLPKFWVYSEAHFASKEDYLRKTGYKENEGGQGGLESTDAYVARMTSYVLLLGAIVQAKPATLQGVNPLGPPFGWIWCARLLNRIPVNRVAACCLEAFLRTAGHSLYKHYQRAFEKLLRTILREYLPKLSQLRDESIGSVVTKLNSYIQDRTFLSPPEGSVFPVSDESARFE